MLLTINSNSSTKCSGIDQIYRILSDAARY